MPVLPSTFFLTLLLTIGLFFFIRGSFKDRTEVAHLVSSLPEEQLLPQLKQYFSQRAYRVKQIDGDRNEVTFEGWVRPSWFLAFFLTLLTALGMMCLEIVLSTIFPRFTTPLLGLILLSPLTGWLYWQKAGRLEQVALQMTNKGIQVTGHRDEVAELRRSLDLRESD